LPERDEEGDGRECEHGSGGSGGRAREGTAGSLAPSEIGYRTESGDIELSKESFTGTQIPCFSYSIHASMRSSNMLETRVQRERSRFLLGRLFDTPRIVRASCWHLNMP